MSESKSQLLHVRNLFQTIRKNNLSSSDYITKMKEYGKMLLSGGYNITHIKIINYVLNGLDFEYDPIVASLTTRLESKFNTLTLQDVQFLLQKHEIRLERA